MANRWGNSGNSGRLYFPELQNHTAAVKLKDACSLEESYDKPSQRIKKQRHYFANKSLYCQSCFSFFPVVMYRCEKWTIKKAELWRSDAFELWCWRRFLRVPWKAEIKPANPKGIQPWIFIRRTDAEAPIPWPPDAKSRLIGKDPDSGKDWGQEEKGRQRMRWLDGNTDSMDMNMSKLWEIVKGRKPSWTACCSPWNHKELHMT